MAKQYLDQTGLSALWSKIKGTFVSASEVEFKLEGNDLKLVAGDEVIATQDVSSFIVDGMLEQVSISEDGNLTFNFNTESGKQPITIPITDIFNPENFYSKDDIDGLVEGINGDVDAIENAMVDLKTTKDIQINGGVLANDATESTDNWPEDWYVKDAEGNKTTTKCIPQGLSLTDIISGLFLKELWPSITRKSTASLSSSIAAVTPVITADTKSGNLVEIGDTLTVSQMAMAAQTYGGTTSTSIGTFTYGYKTTKEGTIAGKGGNKSVNRATPAPKSSTDTYSMTVTIEDGFKDATVPAITANSTAASVTCASFSGKAEEGTNKIATSVTGVASTATVPAIDPVYIVSNLNNVEDARMTDKVDGATLEAVAPTNSGSASVKGVYRLYTTGNQSVESDRDLSSISWSEEEITKLNLVDYSTKQIIYIAFASPSGRAWELYLPKSLGLSVKADALNTASQEPWSGICNTSVTGSKKIQTLAGEVEYDVWSLSGGAPNYVRVTIE